MELIKKLHRQGVTNKLIIMQAYLQRGPVKVTFRKNVGHRVGGFPSRKVGRYVIYGGPEELKAMLWLEFRNDVIIFLEQPMEIEWMEGHIYTPDLMILFRTGQIEVWDPKPAFFYDDAFKEKEKIVTKLLAAYDILFEIMTEDKLPSGAFHYNLGLMMQYRSHPIDEKIKLLSRWPAAQGLRFGDLYHGVLGEPLGLGVVINMVGRGYLSLNLHQPIDDDTLIELGNVHFKG